MNNDAAAGGGMTGGSADARPLSRLDDYEVADGYTDVRGFLVTTREDQVLGTVSDLLVDTDTLEVRHLLVQPNVGSETGAAGGEVRLPIESVRIDTDGMRVFANADALGGASVAATAATGAAGGEMRVTGAEEELAIGTRRVSAGQIGIRKRVETERVSQPLTTTRDEVTVERWPVAEGAGAASRRTPMGEGEIRAPIVEEELVAEKRAVVKEEIVIRTSEVTEQHEVEADVRRERAEIDDRGTTFGRGSVDTGSDRDRTP